MKNLKSAKALLSIGTAAGLLLPGALLAATSHDYLDDDSVRTEISNRPDSEFLRLFTEPDINDDGFIFDQTAFRSHPCFHAVGNEVDYCLDMFGVTTDFDAQVGSDTDDDEADDDDTIDFDVHEQRIIEHNESVTDEGEGEQFREGKRNRSHRLWALCANDDLGQAGCYQSFIRFVTSEDMTVSDIERFFGFRDEQDDVEEENTNDDDEVQSETDEDFGDMTRQERSHWLWGACYDSVEGQASCYRRHYRTAIDDETDLNELENDIR